VLDVAAGSGALGRLLPAAVALDLSAAQLRHNPLPARLQGDAERLPFRDDAFAAAGCAFGINHFPDPGAGLAEMARVAPLVGVLSWVRPEAPYRPKQAVMEVVARHAGSDRTTAGVLADELGERVGSAAAVRALLDGAGLRCEVAEVSVDLPWPGAAAFVDYRLATVGVAGLVDDRRPSAARPSPPWPPSRPTPSPGRPGWCWGWAAASVWRRPGGRAAGTPGAARRAGRRRRGRWPRGPGPAGDLGDQVVGAGGGQPAPGPGGGGPRRARARAWYLVEP
jgi:SAM-dependent methyltransferase